MHEDGIGYRIRDLYQVIRDILNYEVWWICAGPKSSALVGQCVRLDGRVW